LFIAINPRVEAIEQFKNGEKKEEIDAFDNLTPLSDKNRFCINLGYAWLVIFQCFLIFLAFRIQL